MGAIGWTAQGGEIHDVAEARAALDAAKAILLDWDGCLAMANRPTPSGLRLARRFRDRVAIVSNNSTHAPDEFVRVLNRGGVAIPTERIVLAGEAALRSASGAQAALVLGDPKMRARGVRLGVAMAKPDSNPDCVVLLRDLRFSYARLERAVNALRRGARLVVANPDTTHPGPDGAVVPETGALLAAIGACVRLDAVAVDLIGKPGPRLFHAACATLGVAPDRAIMIGDNPATDIAGARALGMGAFLLGAAGKGLTLADLAAGDGEAPGVRTV